MHSQFLLWSRLPVPGGAGLTSFQEDWTIVEHRHADRLVALAAMRGTEIHYAMAPTEQGRGFISRARAAEFLGPLLERRGYLTTRVWDGRCTKFIERLGFRHTWKHGSVNHYMLMALPFARATKES